MKFADVADVGAVILFVTLANVEDVVVGILSPTPADVALIGGSSCLAILNLRE